MHQFSLILDATFLNHFVSLSLKQLPLAPCTEQKHKSRTLSGTAILFINIPSIIVINLW